MQMTFYTEKSAIYIEANFFRHTNFTLVQNDSIISMRRVKNEQQIVVEVLKYMFALEESAYNFSGTL